MFAAAIPTTRSPRRSASRSCGIHHRSRATTSPATAKLLADCMSSAGFRTAWLGPRALGNRSLIADPRKPEMKDILNSRVKHRQPFRPFAPIVLHERKKSSKARKIPSFMLIAKNVRPEWRDKIPPSSMSTARRGCRPCERRPTRRSIVWLKEFDALTGVPVLINTSFNVKG